MDNPNFPDRTAEGLARGRTHDKKQVYRRIVRFTKTQAVDDEQIHYWRGNGYEHPWRGGTPVLFTNDLAAISALADAKGHVQVKVLADED